MTRPLLIALLVAAGCRPAARDVPVDRDVPMHPQPVAHTAVYECGPENDALRLVTRTGPGEIALWLPPQLGARYFVLGQVRAASGARYEGDGVMLWTKGDEAMLEIDGKRYPTCRENRHDSIWEDAKLSGVDFRAVGQEPGWVLEMRHGWSMRLEYDYGQQERVTGCPPPVEHRTEHRSVFDASDEAGRFLVVLEGAECFDSMSGERFSTKVTIEMDDRLLTGCGRPLH